MWTNYSSNTSMGKAIAFDNSTADTATVTLTLNIASGKKVGIKSFSFYNRVSNSGYRHWKMYINGIEVGDSSLYYPATGGTGNNTVKSTGKVPVKNAVEDITGSITVLLKLYDHDAAYPNGNAQGTFRMDDFVLNGYVNDDGGSVGGGYQYANKGGYRYGFNGQEKSDEIKGEGNSYTAEFWEYDPRLGRRWNVDPKPNISISPYGTFANNPIWNFDKKGDSIILGDEPHIQVLTAFETLKKIKRGVQLLNKYVGNSNEHIYLGVISVKGDAIMQTVPNIDTKEYIDKDNNLDEEKFNNNHTSSEGVKQVIHWFANLQKFKKDGKLTHLVGLNIEGDRNVGKLDKYDLAFVMYHEIAAHIKGSTGDASLDHKNFGNSNFIPGMVLRSSSIVGGLIVQPGTEAWSVFKDILALKVKNKDASKANIADYKFMVKTDDNVKKRKGTK